MAPEEVSEQSFLARSYELPLQRAALPAPHVLTCSLRRPHPNGCVQTSASSVLCRGFIVPREMRDTDAVTRFLEAAEQMERILNDSGLVRVERLTEAEIVGTADGRRAAGPLLRPLGFLPTAEYLGIMNRIGHYVFAKADKDSQKWNGTHPDLKMFINMAPTQLMMPKAAENIMNIIKQWEVNPGNIYCDISEKIEFLDEKMALATLEILNGHGINISLDDFGSGKMSLGFLKDSHASMIKFDNSLVKKSRTDDVEITILRSITEIADILDIDIAFVGIEDDNDNNMALENKADYLGGFYYGEALPEDEFETKWLK